MNLKNKVRKVYHSTKKIYGMLAGKEPLVFRQVNVPYVNTGGELEGWRVSVDSMTSNPLVYAGGIGRNIEFELTMVKKYNAEVFAFDPTPKSLSWINTKNIPNKLNVISIGLSGHDGEVEMSPPENSNHVSFSGCNNGRDSKSFSVKRVKTIMNNYGHNRVDILKLDIEGEEYSVIKDVLESNLHISQILVEFHHRFESFEVDMTQNTVRKLNRKGYKLFYISNTGKEMSFIHEDVL
jgi:FkbM family methyltransferase